MCSQGGKLMLIYVLFMAAIAYFLYKESIKLLKNESTLLKEFADDAVAIVVLGVLCLGRECKCKEAKQGCENLFHSV